MLNCSWEQLEVIRGVLGRYRVDFRCFLTRFECFPVIQSDHFDHSTPVKNHPKPSKNACLREHVSLFEIKMPKVPKSPKIASGRSLLTHNDVNNHSGWILMWLGVIGARFERFWIEIHWFSMSFIDVQWFFKSLRALWKPSKTIENHRKSTFFDPKSLKNYPNHLQSPQNPSRMIFNIIRNQQEPIRCDFMWFCDFWHFWPRSGKNRG